MMMEMSTSPTDLICFSHLRWGFVFQRPNHLMVRFERTGHAPMKARLPKAAPEIRIERRPRRDGGPGGGPRGRR